MNKGFTRRNMLTAMASLPLTIPVAARAWAPPVAGSGVTRLSPALDAIVDVDAPIEILGTGYKWAEGPVWVEERGILLFSDPPSNVIHRWAPREGVKPFLTPAGLAGPIPAEIREPGANGLAIDNEGRLVIADSGSRGLARIDLDTGKRTLLADRFEGKKFNSCNDVVVAGSGAIYFTDPPYGLADGDSSSIKELDFNGLFHWSPDGTVTLLDRSLRRPNGVALSPDQRTLYVALSDETRPHILAYSLDDAGMPVSNRLLHDMSDGIAGKRPGLPDGIKTDSRGNIYATGPGGLHVLSPEGERLGTIATGKAIANCAFGEDGRSLFLTSHDKLARIRLKPPA